MDGAPGPDGFSAIADRLIAMAEDPPYRFSDTNREKAGQHAERVKTLQGYDEAEIGAAEQRMGIRFPPVFRAWLQGFGKQHGDLFLGSDLARLDQLEEFRGYVADDLEDAGGPALPETAVVFLMHQGYAYNFLLPEDDAPETVYAYVEARAEWTRAGTDMLDLCRQQLDLMEGVHRKQHERGGHFLEVREGQLKQVHPAKNSGIRPLDREDRFSERAPRRARSNAGILKRLFGRT